MPVINNLRPMLESGDYSDMTIKVRGEKFKVHYVVLCSSSRYWARNEGYPDNWDFDDIHPDDFNMILDCLYSNEWDTRTSLISTVEIIRFAGETSMQNIEEAALKHLNTLGARTTVSGYEDRARWHWEIQEIKEVIRNLFKSYDNRYRLIPGIYPKNVLDILVPVLNSHGCLRSLLDEPGVRRILQEKGGLAYYRNL